MTIDAAAFDFVRRLLRERAAIVLDDGKQYLVDNRLSQLARREGLVSAQDVIDRLRAAPRGPLQRKVIEAMATTETLFFRDGKPYEALRNTIFPELRRLRAAERRLQIWSCGCSSGQEPYSIGMVLHEHFPDLTGWDLRLLATDISTDMLARSRAGRYSQLEINRGLPGALLARYFDRAGHDWQIRSDLRRMVEFRELNLAGPWGKLPPADLIMLRNVLIYFDLDTKRQAETTTNLDDRFEPVRSDGTVYYRPRRS
ncbi:MAG: protein-glutamate O-methyltransferase CheR [Deltaproteobacteria bacterium]|nr:MAG: protein-glutamate O-methyltransferase CheR [Deltaproteobacteria bacterium]